MKPHIFTSEDSPARWTGGDLVALCGATVKNAEVMAAADSSQGFFVKTDSAQLCQKCWRKLQLLQGDSKLRVWEYAIREGQVELEAEAS